MFKKPGSAISIFSKSLMSALIKSFNFIANLFGFNLFVLAKIIQILDERSESIFDGGISKLIPFKFSASFKSSFR